MNMPDSVAVTNPAIAPGSRNTRLAWSTEALKPYPVAARSIWTNCVRPRKPKYKPEPTNTVARLVSRTGRRVNISVDTNGWRCRRSHAHHATSTTTPAAAVASVAGDVQPHEFP